MSNLSIDFHCEDISYTLENESSVKDWIDKTIQHEGKELGELNIILCSDSYLHKINVEHLDHDTFTDIITFDFVVENIINGDLFISVDRIVENSSSFSSSVSDELNRVIIHGVLHLIGYADKSPEDKALMTKKEDFYLSLRTF